MARPGAEAPGLAHAERTRHDPALRELEGEAVDASRRRSGVGSRSVSSTASSATAPL